MKKKNMLLIIFLFFSCCFVTPECNAADEECEDYHFHFHCYDDTDIPRPNYFTTYQMCRSGDCKSQCDNYMKQFPDIDEIEEYTERSEECSKDGLVIGTFIGDELCYETCNGYVGWYLHWRNDEVAREDCGGEIKDVMQSICFLSSEDPEDEEEDDCCMEDEESCCKSKICVDDKVGNPIHILSGANKEKETDIHFNTPFSKGLKVYRSYSSKSKMDSPIGFGWNHNYNVVLEFSPPPFEAQSCMIRDEYGRIHHFSDNEGDEVYEGIRSYNGLLAHNSDGTYTWFRPNGIKYKFNNLLRFITKEDGNGNTQTLTYDEQGRLSGVSDESTDRSISFAYNAQGRIDYIAGPIIPAVPDGIWVRYQYDAAGNLTRVEYADDGNGSTASGFEYKYEDVNDAHNLTEKYNLAGDFLSSWQYDSRDSARQNTTRDGKSITIEGGLYEKVVTNEQGVKKTYTIEDINGRKTITNVTGDGCSSCAGDAVRYGYDDQRRINKIEYANGRIDQYADFDAGGRYQTEIQAAGTADERIFHYTYHPETLEQLSITETSNLGSGDKETIFDYDDDGNGIPNENPTRLMHRKIVRGFTYDTAGVVVPYEYITTYDYTAKGQLASVNGPLPGDQDRITYTYDPATGDRLTEIRPLVDSTTYGYDAAGNITSITAADGSVTIITYDGRNRQLTSTRNGITTSRTYTAAGELDTATDALNRTQDYTYNAAGLMEKIIDPSGNFIYFGYNAYGQRIEESIFAADNTQTHYRGTDYGDPANNPGLISGKPWKSIHRKYDDSADLETTYAYDSAGKITSLTDANGNITTYVYDLFNRLDQVIQPGNLTTTYTYDSQGNLNKVTDAETRTTTYTYDDMGRLMQTDSPDTGTTRYSYDEAGNLRFKVQNGNTIEYQYDLLGRLTRILYSDPTQNVTMTYDSGTGANLLGRLASVSDPSGLVEYSYDPNGKLKMETRTVNDIAFVTGYRYDKIGNLRSITYPTGQTIEYQPDAVDPARIGAVLLNPSKSSQILATGITYKPFGPITAMTLGNGTTVSRDFDKNYQIASITEGTILQRVYSPDNVGNIIEIYDLIDVMRSQSFSYDHLYRLTNAVGVYGTIDYTYDEVGNRTGRSHGAEHDTYTYDSDANRLQAITGSHPEQFTYNDEGSTVTRTPGTAQITYNYYAGTQRLKTVVKKRHPPDADPARYIYNGAGQRVQSTNSNPILYHYDRNGFLIAETSPTGTPIKSYIWLHGQPLAMIDHQVSPRTGDIDHNSTVGDADLALLTTRRGNVHCTSSTIYYYHNDHLGTPQKMTNSSGAVVWAADYLPFGQANIIIENVVNNLRFAGQYYDQETGLHYNYHRYYDPTLGRYLRADPVGFAEGVDLYTYVASNPINRLDPKGLFGIGGSAYFVGGAEATLSIHNCCEKSDAYEVTVLTVCGGLGIGLGGAFTPGGTVGGVSSRSGCPRTRYYFKHENVLIYHSVNVQADSQGPSAGADVGAYGLYTAWVFCSDTVISKEKVGCCVN